MSEYDKKLKAIQKTVKKYGMRKITIAKLIGKHPFWIGHVIEGNKKGSEKLLDTIIEALEIKIDEE